MTEAPFRLGLLGHPVSHSLSPAMHSAWLAAAGLAGSYKATDCPDEAAFAAALDEGWRSGATGFNVTLPHKGLAARLAATASAEARRMGAANTLVRGPKGWHAESTDPAGFAFQLERHGAAPDGLRDAPVLVIGAGGAADAVLLVLAAAGARITVVNRTPKAENWLSREGHAVAFAGLGDLEALAAEAALVVHTTSAGHSGQTLPPLGPGRGRLFADLSYGQAFETVAAAPRQAGWKVCDGLPMLAGQGAESFALWTGRRPDPEQALRLLRAAGAGPTPSS